MWSERLVRVDRGRLLMSQCGQLDFPWFRERDVLEQAARGLHAKEIAVALGISPRTVEIHKTHIMEKLGVRNVAELFASPWPRRQGMTTPVEPV
jgi:hypothetical protein